MIRKYLPSVLIAATFAVHAYPCLEMIGFSQFPEGAPLPRTGVIWRYDQYVHTLGFAGITLVVVGLLILFFPFQRRERWAWCALAVICVVYFCFGYIVPRLRPLPKWSEVVAAPWQFRMDRDFAIELLLLVFPMTAGLALSFPRFFRKPRV